MGPAFRPWRITVALVASLACGGGGGGNDTPTSPTNPDNPGSPSASAAVAMNSGLDQYGYSTNVFAPSSVAITRNGMVTWSNSTGIAHNVTFTTSGAPAGIPDHTAGTNSRSFATAGTFNYQCTNHGGMTGSVTVQ